VLKSYPQPSADRIPELAEITYPLKIPTYSTGINDSSESATSVSEEQTSTPISQPLSGSGVPLSITHNTGPQVARVA